jgi:hypothetical protein
MQIDSRKVLLGLLLITTVRGQDHKVNEGRQTTLRHKEVSVSVQSWDYSRIYPLLDGLFQDANAATVIVPQLDANKSNATSLDATQQSVQMQLQFNRLAGIQNAAVAQVASNNAALQSLIAQQTAPLLQQYTDAVAGQNQAQNALSTAIASGDSAAQTAAQTVLNNATTQVTNVTNAIKAVTGLLTTLPSGASTSLTQPGAPTSSQLPSAVVTNATAVSNGSPNLPPTKQMDNYLDLLWERLSRLIGTIAKPDSVTDDDIYLVKFDTGIYPLDRKKQLLDVTYKLDACDAGVLELFPRTAALNITENKYKDSSFFISGLLSFFSFGANVAYNREHLQASQWLGQSSYITGHGVGDSEFGWLFGIGLGDSAISPGVRSTFALIHAKRNCEVKVNLQSAIWEKPPKFRIEKYSMIPSEESTKACGADEHCRKAFPAPHEGPWRFSSIAAPTQASNLVSGEADRAAQSGAADGLPPVDPPGSTAGRARPSNAVTYLAFNRTETAASSCVALAITLSSDMDQQQTVTVDGALIPRVRDTFGRAAQGGSQGLLEANSLTNCPNWIPNGPRSLLLTLNASNYGNRFPQILLNSPLAESLDVAVSVTQSAKSSEAIQITGQAWYPACLSSASCLPSLAFVKSSSVPIGVARRQTLAGAGTVIDQLSVTLLNPPASGPAPVVGSTPPAVQVLTNRGQQVWADDVEVDWVPDPTHIVPLTCLPDKGSRLLCDTPQAAATAYSGRGLTLAVYDPHHSGGAIRSFVHTPPCGNSDLPCPSPLVWNLNPPVLDCSSCSKPSSDGKATVPNLGAARWTMEVSVVNVAEGDKATLLKYPGSAESFDEPVRCAGGPCRVIFTFPRSRFNDLGDLMTLKIAHNGAVSKPFWITNVRANVSPQVSYVSSDFSTWSGQNLVFDKVQVNSTVASVQCVADASTASTCSKTSSDPFDSSAGYMYFVAPDQSISIPMMQANATGPNTPVKFTPPPPPPPAKSKKAEKAAPAVGLLSHGLAAEFAVAPPPPQPVPVPPPPSQNLAPAMTISQ